MFRNSLKVALRNLRHNKSYSLLNIAGLSIGMTAAILIFLWVNNEMSYDNYHPQADRIYRVTSHITKAKWTWETSPLALSRRLAPQLPEIESIASLYPSYYTTLRINDNFFTETQAAFVDSSWFNIFHYDFTAGNPTAFFSLPNNLILTQSRAKKYFGDTDPMGRVIHIDNTDYRVSGIVRDNPANSSFQFEMLMPIDALLTSPEDRQHEMGWGQFNYQNYLKLRPGARPEKVAATMTRLFQQQSSNTKGDFLTLIPLKDIHFETGLSQSGKIIHASSSTVYIFSILGIFLLVIACINYVNITTARASIRAKEVGIRKLIGAGKTSLFFQFVTESLVISACSLLITIFLVPTFIPFLSMLTDVSFTSPFLIAGTWKIIGLTLLTATLLNSIYPALMLSSFRPLNVLKGATLLKFKDVYLRKGLVVLQFTFSIVLIIGTLIIQRQLGFIRHNDPGYNRYHVFSIGLPRTLFQNMTPEQKHTQLNTVKQQLKEIAGVTSVSIASGSIVNVRTSNSGSADWEGHDTSFRPTVYRLYGDEDYQRTMQLQVREGRWFDKEKTTDAHNFILNQTAVNTFKMHQPILGQRFIFDGDTGKIIGVVRDFHFASLHSKIQPIVMKAFEDWNNKFFIRVAPGKETQAVEEARAIWKRYAPSEPYSYSFLDEEFDNLYRTDQKIAQLIMAFSMIAILISCLGLFGLAAFTGQQRVKEIGIRKVLGATVSGIVTLLARDFVGLVLVSVVIASPIAWYAMHQWLQDFAYRIPLSGWFFLLAALIAIFMAVLTVSTQAIRAARANPVKNLRTE